MDDKILEKLVDTFDEFKEMVIRIDENVKGLTALKSDMDIAKVDIAQTKESTKSAHKRIDSMEKAFEEKEKDIKWLKRQIVIGGITFFFTVLGGIVLFVITK